MALKIDCLKNPICNNRHTSISDATGLEKQLASLICVLSPEFYNLQISCVARQAASGSIYSVFMLIISRRAEIALIFKRRLWPSGKNE